MLVRDLRLLPYEFCEVLDLNVYERDSRTHHVTQLFRIRVPLSMGNITHHFSYSVDCAVGVVPNQVARELFHLWNFLMDKDWKLKMESYADFCDCKL